MADETSRKPKRPLLITLTGPEGCGKSTNQDFIIRFAAASGLIPIKIKGDRYTCGHALQRLKNLFSTKPRQRRQYITEPPPPPASSHPGAKPAKPSLKRRLRTLRRGVCYLIDALIFRLILRLPKHRHADLIVFDRYIYDEMTKVIEHLPRLVSLIHRISLRPDLAFLITAEPQDLVARRPGSSLVYYTTSLRRFAALADRCPELIHIPPGDLAATQAVIRAKLESLIAPHPAGSTDPDSAKP